MAAETALPRLDSIRPAPAPSPPRGSSPRRSDYSERLARQIAGESDPRSSPSVERTVVPTATADVRAPVDPSARTGESSVRSTTDDGVGPRGLLDGQDPTGSASPQSPQGVAFVADAGFRVTAGASVEPPGLSDAVSDASEPEAEVGERPIPVGPGAMSVLPDTDAALPFAVQPPWSFPRDVPADSAAAKGNDEYGAIPPPAAAASLFAGVNVTSAAVEPTPVKRPPEPLATPPEGFASGLLPVEATPSVFPAATFAPVAETTVTTPKAEAAPIPGGHTEARATDADRGIGPQQVPPVETAESARVPASAMTEPGLAAPVEVLPIRIDDPAAPVESDAAPVEGMKSENVVAVVEPAPAPPSPGSRAKAGPKVPAEPLPPLEAAGREARPLSAAETVTPSAGASSSKRGGDATPHRQTADADPLDGADRLEISTQVPIAAGATGEPAIGRPEASAAEVVATERGAIVPDVSGEPQPVAVAPVALEPASPPASEELGGRPVRGVAAAGTPSTEAAADELTNHAAAALRAADGLDRPIRIRLTPPELGVLRVEIARHDGRITAQFEVTTAAAHSALSDHVSAMRDSLARTGVTVDRIEVRLAEPSREERSSGERERFGDGQPGHHGRDQGRQDQGGGGRRGYEWHPSAQAEEADGSAGGGEPRASGSPSDGPAPVATGVGRSDVLDIQV